MDNKQYEQLWRDFGCGDSPVELVGFMLKSRSGDYRWRKVKNVSRKPQNNYRISMYDWRKLIHHSKSNGEKIIGIIHSHPPGCSPIPTVADMNHTSGLPECYLIVDRHIYRYDSHSYERVWSYNWLKWLLGF